jgi:hypothetical protein
MPVQRRMKARKERDKACVSCPYGTKASEHPHPFGNHTLPVVEPEDVILHEEASLLVGHQLKHLYPKIKSSQTSIPKCKIQL